MGSIFTQRAPSHAARDRLPGPNHPGGARYRRAMPVDPRAVLTRPAPDPTGPSAYGDDPDQVADLRLPAGTGPAAAAGRRACTAGSGGPSTTGGTPARWPRPSPRCGYPVAQLEYRRTGQPGGGWPGTLTDVLPGWPSCRRWPAEALPGRVSPGRADPGRALRRRPPGAVRGGHRPGDGGRGARPGPGGRPGRGVPARSGLGRGRGAARRRPDAGPGPVRGGGSTDVGTDANTHSSRARLGRSAGSGGDEPGFRRGRRVPQVPISPLLNCPDASISGSIDPESVAWPQVLAALRSLHDDH